MCAGRPGYTHSGHGLLRGSQSHPRRFEARGCGGNSCRPGRPDKGQYGTTKHRLHQLHQCCETGDDAVPDERQPAQDRLCERNLQHWFPSDQLAFRGEQCHPDQRDEPPQQRSCRQSRGPNRRIHGQRRRRQAHIRLHLADQLHAERFLYALGSRIESTSLHELRADLPQYRQSVPVNASGMEKEIRAILHCLTAALASLRLLARSREGNVAMLVGLFAIPLVIAGGIATDVGRAYIVEVRLGAALDAAALAVGSETNHTATQLADDLQHYFTANYPSTALGTSVTVAPVPSTADLAATTVNYRAQATVPMVFMPLIGINNINVSVTAQTKKTTGLEVAVVLDNTGSMLCGADDSSESNCAADVPAADTSCTNSSNNSRICTLINASKTFVDTLTSAINSSQQLYLSIVPYVTTVNVGSSFCSGATSCTNIT